LIGIDEVPHRIVQGTQVKLRMLTDLSKAADHLVFRSSGRECSVLNFLLGRRCDVLAERERTQTRGACSPDEHAAQVFFLYLPPRWIGILFKLISPWQ
jgi:hypothetical protein